MKKVMRGWLRKVQTLQRKVFGILAFEIRLSESGSAINVTVFEWNYHNIENGNGDGHLYCFSLYDFFDEEENQTEYDKIVGCLNDNLRKAGLQKLKI